MTTTKDNVPDDGLTHIISHRGTALCADMEEAGEPCTDPLPVAEPGMCPRCLGYSHKMLELLVDAQKRRREQEVLDGDHD